MEGNVRNTKVRLQYDTQIDSTPHPFRAPRRRRQGRHRSQRHTPDSALQDHPPKYEPEAVTLPKPYSPPSFQSPTSASTGQRPKEQLIRPSTLEFWIKLGIIMAYFCVYYWSFYIVIASCIGLWLQVMGFMDVIMRWKYCVMQVGNAGFLSLGLCLVWVLYTEYWPDAIDTLLWGLSEINCSSR
ncbi:hypothetical protein FN846DRAFT_964023 [Sphaerosporella brunnea]|uniref:Uncharacterized protein n=1 Tax=Sphaerosporella brunnea TaxID=1250544 RepID=A0A5J5ENE5_9PEZI|nr:hypothetical protein FN846DRAFT_964023 [Sphaerosporella brunnea]